MFNHLLACRHPTFIFTLLIFLVSGCTNKADFKYEKGTGYIRANNVSIESYRTLDWRVGKYGKQKVSRGFRFTFEFPRLDEEAVETLYKKREVNAWLIRVRKRQGVRNENLGYYFMRMVYTKPGESHILKFIPPKKGSIGVNYAAASISTRLDQLPCPALGHRLLIDEAELEETTEKDQLWVAGASENTRVGAKVEGINYNPVVINGGMNLVGRYYIDLALYNSEDKRRLSSYVALSNFVEIEKEVVVGVKGCENYIVPDKGDEGPVDKFKFGR